MTEFANTDLGSSLIDAVKSRNDSLVTVRIDEWLSLIRTRQVSESSVLDAVIVLQNSRNWDEVVHLTEAVIAHGGDVGPQLLRRYSQCLIERGALSGADCVLRGIESRDPGDQRDEVRGLRGRIAKQRYINSENTSQLIRAIDAYGESYRQADIDPLWPGGNLLALLHRADRNGTSVPAGNPSVGQLARELLDHLRTTTSGLRNVWQRSTEIEARLALDDVEQAEALARNLAESRNANAFEMGSLKRQLAEIWQLAPDHPVMLALQTSNLGLGQGSDVAVPDADALERILGTERPVYYAQYQRGLEVARAVCLITDQYDSPFGTGFVIPGSELSPGLGADLVLLTNAHVISPAHGMAPSRARAHFQALAGSVVGDHQDGVSVDEIELIWTSSPQELDTTVLRLDAPKELLENTIRVADTQPDPHTDDPFVYVVGHPAGRPLSMSIRGNELLDINEQFLHYMAPTEPGSSGSPVFDKQWNLVGLHHAGHERMPRLDDSGRYHPANEGINMAAIRNGLSRQM